MPIGFKEGLESLRENNNKIYEEWSKIKSANDIPDGQKLIEEIRVENGKLIDELDKKMKKKPYDYVHRYSEFRAMFNNLCKLIDESLKRIQNHSRHDIKNTAGELFKEFKLSSNYEIKYAKDDIDGSIARDLKIINK